MPVRERRVILSLQASQPIAKRAHSISTDFTTQGQAYCSAVVSNRPFYSPKNAQNPLPQKVGKDTDSVGPLAPSTHFLVELA